jgi:hypothetical protein
VDGSFVGLCSGLPGMWGFVRQRVGADKSVCRGAEGSLAKSLIFTPAVMRLPNGAPVTYRLPNLRTLFAAAAIYWASTDIRHSSAVLCVTLMNESRAIYREV